MSRVRDPSPAPNPISCLARHSAFERGRRRRPGLCATTLSLDDLTPCWLESFGGEAVVLEPVRSRAPTRGRRDQLMPRRLWPPAPWVAGRGGAAILNRKAISLVWTY